MPTAQATTTCQDIPVEILRSIFLNAATWSFDEKLALLHVCFQWREVAFSIPDIWTLVNERVFISHNIAERFLGLSKSESLFVDIVAGPSGYRLQYFPPLSSLSFLAAAPRMRHISMKGPSTTVMSLLSDALRDVPRLKSLELINTTRNWRTIRMDMEEGTISQLTRMKLENYRLKEWNPLFFTNLVTLSITFNIGVDCLEVRPRRSQFVAALNQAVNLQTLILVYTLPSSLIQDDVVLPRLTNLEVIDFIPSCTNFLHHLHVPTTARVSVMCSHAEDQNTGSLITGALPFFSTLENFLNRGGQQANVLELLRCDSPMGIRAGLVLYRPTGGEIQIELPNICEERYPEFLQLINISLDLSQVRELSLTAEDTRVQNPAYLGQLNNIIAHATTLSEIQIYRSIVAREFFLTVGALNISSLTRLSLFDINVVDVRFETRGWSTALMNFIQANHQLEGITFVNCHGALELSKEPFFSGLFTATSFRDLDGDYNVCLDAQ
jgi:hypothetical protein